MNLQEALERAGLPEQARAEVEAARAAREVREAERRERNANLAPHQRWWQNFRMSVTSFEIPVFIKVECEKWAEGLDFIRARNLNKVTTRCKTKEEAVEQLREKIMAWQAETQLNPDQQPPAGALLYWRIYG